MVLNSLGAELNRLASPTLGTFHQASKATLLPAVDHDDAAADHKVFWQALCDDAGQAVLIMSLQGYILVSNKAAADLLGSPLSRNVGQTLRATPATLSINGLHLSELLTEDMAAERVALVEEVINSGQPICLEGMVRGRNINTVYRPLSARLSGESCVLVVLRCTSDAPTDQTVPARRALHQDCGELSKLTSRELDILRLIGLGLSTAGIAKTLERSVKTVEWHRVALGDKLGVANRVELARIAISTGLVSAQPTSAPALTSAPNSLTGTPASPSPAKAPAAARVSALALTPAVTPAPAPALVQALVAAPARAPARTAPPVLASTSTSAPAQSRNASLAFSAETKAANPATRRAINIA